MRCGVGCRCGSDPAFLWLWYRPATTAPMQPLAWELPYAADVVLKRQKKKKKKKEKKKERKKENCSASGKKKKKTYLPKKNVSSMRK